ncbi:hypothetical protein D3C78_1603200 [compost metagenome]
MLGAGQIRGLDQGVELGVGLDAAEARHLVADQGVLHLLPDPVLEDAAATMGHQHPAAGRHISRQLGDLAFAEVDAGGVVEGEVAHGAVPLSLSADYSAGGPCPNLWVTIQRQWTWAEG